MKRLRISALCSHCSNCYLVTLQHSCQGRIQDLLEGAPILGGGLPIRSIRHKFCRKLHANEKIGLRGVACPS